MKKLIKLNTSIDKNAKSNQSKILSIVLILIFLTSGAASILLKNYIFAVIGLLIAALVLFLNYINRTRSKQGLEKMHENEFVDIINYFETFLANDLNIYQSFQEVLVYASPWMRNKIETMLAEIDEDKSVKPFIKFAQNFKNTSIENVMVSIYQMIEDGHNNTSLNQFDLLFDKFEENSKREFIRKKENELERLNMFPLIGAIITTVILTLSILSIVGEMINGF